MSTFPIVAITITLTLVAFLVVAFVLYRRKGERPKTDYRVFFILGIVWLPLGIATDNPGFWGLGAVFLIVGLLNRDKWKDTKKWSELSSSERNMRLVVVLGLALAVALATAVFFLARS